MKNKLDQQTISAKSSFQTLIVVAAVGVILSSITSYVFGLESLRIFYKVVDWVGNLALALLLSKLCTFIKLFSKTRILTIIPYLALVPSFLYSVDFLIIRSNIDDYRVIETFFYTLSFLTVLCKVFISVVLIKELTVAFVGVKSISTTTNTAYLEDQVGSKSSNKKLESEQENTLVRSRDSILDNVITSTLSRASASSRTASFAIVVIIVFVLIGGGASVGTVALNEAQKVRELETERLKMLEIMNAIQTNDSGKFSERNKEVIEIIQSRYGDQNSYKAILENIEKQSEVKWTDIAMRVTIAALTLFLVQIFFHIYKYNQQQESQLLTKAELFELYKEPDADKGELRAGLLLKVDSNPRFEKTPSTPSEQIINAFAKSNNSKA